MPTQHVKGVIKQTRFAKTERTRTLLSRTGNMFSQQFPTASQCTDMQPHPLDSRHPHWPISQGHFDFLFRNQFDINKKLLMYCAYLRRTWMTAETLIPQTYILQPSTKEGKEMDWSCYIITVKETDTYLLDISHMEMRKPVFTSYCPRQRRILLMVRIQYWNRKKMMYTLF